MRWKFYLLLVLIVSSGIFYYNLTGKTIYQKETVLVKEIIDGDTFKDTNGNTYRLKGINTPEKSMPYYQEAKTFLKDLIENQTINVEVCGTDRYGRFLTYVYHNNRLINREILQAGLGSLYYYETDKYYEELKKAEEYARNNNLGIWKKSENFACLKLVGLKYKEISSRCKNEEQIILINDCDKSLDITFKDDATHIYKENIKGNSVLIKNFSCIWNDDGDSLYVWDDERLGLDKDNSKSQDLNASKGLLVFYRY